MKDDLIHFRCPICSARMATRAANAEQHVECPGLQFDAGRAL